MVKMTYRQAIQIQERQMVWYRQAIGRRGIKAIRQRTIPCPGDPDNPVHVTAINSLVPRGAEFEKYIRNIGKRDPLTYYWYKAMEDNKLYSC